jgi:hypothetical protein
MTRDQHLMNARHLAEIGGWLAMSSEWLVGTHNQRSGCQASQYWVHCRCRLQRWNAALRMFHDDLNDPTGAHQPWAAIDAVGSEIIVSELLTRVWAAILIEQDQRRGQDDRQAMAHSILIGHLEASNRILRLAIDWQAISPVAKRLNRLHHQVERWTDLLLGWLPRPEAIAGVGFDRARVTAFADDGAAGDAESRQQRRRISLASLSETLTKLAARTPANPEINRQIAASVLASVPTTRFDYDLLPKSVWLLKLEQSNDDAQALVDELIQSV